jgi:hypothetical protein
VPAVEYRREVRESERQPPPDLLHQHDGLVEAFRRRGGHVLGAHRRRVAAPGDQRRQSPSDGRFARQPVESAARGVTLPAAVAPARASGAARDDHHVTDLAGEAAAAADQLAVGHHSPADACAQGHHDEVVDTASRAPLVFGERRAVRVILAKHHRTAERFTQQRTQVGARSRPQVRREGEAPITAHHAGQSNADRHLFGDDRVT